MVLRTIFSFTPFMVCAFWFTTFALHYRQSDVAKRVLTLFLAVCTVLYFCHGVYFTMGLPHAMECLWALCSLSVYPLYYVYICRLTSFSLTPAKWAIIILPIITVVLLKCLFPGRESDMVRQILMMLQVGSVVYFGYKRLHRFDRMLAEVYADTEGRDTTAVKHLLAAFVITSACSALANALGKEFFATSQWLILIVLLPFAIMLFMLSYIGFTRSFTVEQYVRDVTDDDATAEEMEEDALGRALTRLMTEDRYFLQHNLKIGDVVRQLGVCRTYVSNYINREYDCSFSDYVNRMRVEYAKELMHDSPDTKLLVIAEQSGFSSEQSFYRNFRKFTGMTPAEWEEKSQANR